MLIALVKSPLTVPITSAIFVTVPSLESPNVTESSPPILNIAKVLSPKVKLPAELVRMESAPPEFIIVESPLMFDALTIFPLASTFNVNSSSLVTLKVFSPIVKPLSVFVTVKLVVELTIVLSLSLKVPVPLKVNA